METSVRQEVPSLYFIFNRTDKHNKTFFFSFFKKKKKSFQLTSMLTSLKWSINCVFKDQFVSCTWAFFRFFVYSSELKMSDSVQCLPPSFWYWIGPHANLWFSYPQIRRSKQNPPYREMLRTRGARVQDNLLKTGPSSKLFKFLNRWNASLMRGRLKCRMLTDPLLRFQCYCVSRTFGVIIIGPKTEQCKLGSFCPEAIEAWRVQGTTDTGVIFFLTWG